MDRRLYTAVTCGNVGALTKLIAFHGHLQIAEKLLEFIAEDIESGNERSRQFTVAKNLQGNIPLHEAAKGGHYKVVNALLENSCDIVSIVNNVGETALFQAAKEGHKQIVVKLVYFLSVDFDKRTSDADGRTPLHVSATKAHYSWKRVYKEGVPVRTPAARSTIEHQKVNPKIPEGSFLTKGSDLFIL
ncbi:hypothetical protein SUGI_0972780 [Cryptomeria japonica]|nr:hypothetical protein SUGI_0972780 [Cryptomeria japonica]